MSDQDQLSVILDQIERDARWRYSDPQTAVDIADNVPGLVKALRRAVTTIGELNDLYCGINDMTGRNVLSEIASILSSAGDKEEKKNLEEP